MMEHMVWNMDPIAFSLGGVRVFWYGILFATAIMVGLEIMKWIYKSENKDLSQIDSLFLYIVIGIVVGARLGHCLFYEPSYYLSHPLEILYVWKGGLASHGGGLGALIAIYMYSKKHSLDLMWFLDRITIPTAFFAFFVRMGNLMNSEILGKITDSAWGVVFSRVDMQPRYPVQVFEAISYLTIAFVLLFVYKQYKEKTAEGFLFGFFLVSVFTVRFLIEFLKERQAEYASDLALSAGQMLSIPFILAGLYFIYRSVQIKKGVI